MLPIRPLTALASPVCRHQHVSVAKLLSPLIAPYQQSRQASIVSSLSNVRSSYNRRIRVGRGPAAGKGKTSGRGHKGQKQRGKVPLGFNGGQTPDIIVHGVRGFENINAADFNVLNISRIAKWIALGRIDPNQVITVRSLVKSGCISQAKDGVKLLARTATRQEETLKTPIRIVVSRASQSAIEAVEAAGGTIVTRYYSPTSMKRVMRGETHPFYSLQMLPLAEYSQQGSAAESRDAEDAGKDVEPTKTTDVAGHVDEMKRSMARFQYRLADASSRKDIEYYRDPGHRGYLSHLVEEGQGPSLYFKEPTKRLAGGKKKVKGSRAGPQGAENRLW